MSNIVHAPFAAKKADLIHSCPGLALYLTFVGSVHLHKGVYIIYYYIFASCIHIVGL